MASGGLSLSEKATAAWSPKATRGEMPSWTTDETQRFHPIWSSRGFPSGGLAGLVKSSRADPAVSEKDPFSRQIQRQARGIEEPWFLALA